MLLWQTCASLTFKAGTIQETLKLLVMNKSYREYFKEYYDIYDEMLKSEVKTDPGYLVSFRPLEGKNSFVSVDSRWIGFDNKREIRKASLVNPIITKSHFKLLNYPLTVIENIAELSIFLRLGGHAIVNKVVAETSWTEILKPKVVTKTYEEGYIDYETVTKKYKERFARGNYRAEIFDRDNYQCRICGSSPDDGVHIRIEVHHIKPWEEGGITSPENLITLCASCHNGASKINREVLYRKIGLHFPYVKHKFFQEKISWTSDQRRSHDQLADNAVTLKIKNIL